MYDYVYQLVNTLVNLENTC